MILATGCSFTYGEELNDPQTESYPSLLGEMMEMEVFNAGLRGASNDYISRWTMDYTLRFNPEIVIVQWTETNRFETFAHHPPMSLGYHKDYVGPMQLNIRSTNRGVDFADEYYKNWFDERFSFYKWIWQVIGLQNFLENQGVEYVMFNGFGNQQLIQKYDLDEYMYIDTDCFLGWPDEGFVEWTYGCPIKPKGHPGEEAHKVVAEKLYEYLQN